MCRSRYIHGTHTRTCIQPHNTHTFTQSKKETIQIHEREGTPPHHHAHILIVTCKKQKGGGGDGKICVFIFLPFLGRILK